MNALQEIGQAVHVRRTQMGFTQAALAKRCGLSRQTINQLEAGSIADLSVQRVQRVADTLGLTLQVAGIGLRSRTHPPRMSALHKAAQTASVSFREPITPVRLRHAITKGADAQAMPYLLALLDDAPVALLAALAEELGRDADGATAVWKTYRTLAAQVHSRRDLWQ